MAALAGARNWGRLLLTGSGRGPVMVCAAICSLWLAAALAGTSDARLLPEDSAHAAGTARNLARGLGYTIEFVPFHLGLHDAVRHVPEWHGLLRPFTYAALFAAFGIDETWLPAVGFGYGAATGFLAFLFARTLFGAGAGLLACLLTLSNRALGHWAWAGTDDVGFAFFFLCTIYFAYLGLTRGGRFVALAGLAGGLALLEKQTALYLPAVFVLVLWLGRGRGAGLRWVVWLFGPFALALGAYLARNVAAHGGPGFRLGFLNWIYKLEGPAAIYRFYEGPQSLGEILGRIGVGGVVSIQLEQLTALLSAVFLPTRSEFTAGLGILAIGVPSLLLHLRRDPLFAWLSLCSVAGAVAFVCGLYAVESRYFLMLVPLVAVSLAGVLAALAEGRFAERPVPRWLSGAAVGISIAIVLHAAVATAALAGRKRTAHHRRRCAGAVAWIERHIPPGEPLLSAAPAWVSWVTNRPAVMIPTGEPDEVERVAAHYNARWAFYSRRRHGAARLLRGVELEHAFGAGRCGVYRLAGAGAASPGGSR